MPRRPPPSPAAPANVYEPAAGKRRPEAMLEREILRRFGCVPDLLIAKNEVGTGFTRGVMDDVLKALPACFHAEIAAIFRKWAITWGLGVGSPDLICSAGGVWLGVELKAEDGRVSDVQRNWHAAAERRGAMVAVVRSEEEMAAAIERARERAGR